MEFRAAWDQVAAMAGEKFQTDKGDEFTYVFKKTFVVIDPGRISIPRTNFEKVFKQTPDRKPVQGERFIQSIYQRLNL